MSGGKARRGFALIELPVALAFLALQGLLIAYIFSLFTGPAPWYAWVIAALILPGEVIAYAAVVMTMDSIAARRAIRKKSTQSNPSCTK